MNDSEHVRPLAPATILPVSDESASNTRHNTLRRRKRMKCLICVTVTSLILLTIVLTLVFTVFRVKDPTIKMNRVMVNGLDSVMGTDRVQLLGTNISMIVDVSVKNPNMASFKYSNTTTDIYYKGTVVGEARGLPGKARPHRTSRMNLTVDIMIDRILADPGLSREVSTSGLVNVWSYTRVGGKVKILVVKKHVTVKMNCTMAVNITAQAIQDVDCKNKIGL
ncbi:PREDICTED: late embryogenesis abundant protein At1g64065-like [Camelina sativa]|uniref:Late embryogenesis abundant protein At1g64065-like n=1 Tax=Camelina sativa TaxID=90675 RepID=A0ABM0YVU2_CAMSA|nr:PREDICTED: late embryogenesis abundant protein At1g64065-like [Camelina sativa]